MIHAIAIASALLAALALALPPVSAALLVPAAVASVDVALLVAEVRHGGVKRTVGDVAMSVARPGSWVPSAVAVSAPLAQHAFAWWWPLAVLVLVFATDVERYAVHRLCHEVPALWRVHEVHHRPGRVSVLTRSWADPLDPSLWSWAPLVALAFGVPPQVVAASQLAMLTAATQHCGAPLAEPHWPLLFTSHHHRHHANGGQPVNLALWSTWPDRLFGTLR